jgi:glycosyltransferase involved in cell wall biosynthesis
MKKIVVIGSAFPLRGGGLASFNERLARQFQIDKNEVLVNTFSLQYPSFLFPGSSQYSNEKAPDDLKIEVDINSINPLSWWRVGRKIKKNKPDFVVVRFWIPFMGPCLGTINRIIKKNKHTKILCICDNALPHEKRFGDRWLSSYFFKSVDGFITMSSKVYSDLSALTEKKIIQVEHPMYDSFGDSLPIEKARFDLGLQQNKKTILFFGFIREYKGLDMLFEALGLLKNMDYSFYSTIQVVIAGEFYQDRSKYDLQIEKLGIQDCLVLKTEFIHDSDVKQYLSAADVVIQPYRNATQSGVTPLAYHFEKPMIVTNVGALPENVPHGKVGLVCEPNHHSIASSLVTFFTLDYDSFVSELRVQKKKYSWENLTKSIYELHESLNDFESKSIKQI